MTSGVRKVKESFQSGENVEPLGPFQDWAVVAHTRPVWSMDRLKNTLGVSTPGQGNKDSP